MHRSLREELAAETRMREQLAATTVADVLGPLQYKARCVDERSGADVV